MQYINSNNSNEGIPRINSIYELQIIDNGLFLEILPKHKEAPRTSDKAIDITASRIVIPNPFANNVQ